LNIVNDQRVLDQVVPEIEKLERSDGEHGFDEYVRMLKTSQLPQPRPTIGANVILTYNRFVFSNPGDRGNHLELVSVFLYD